MSRLDEIREYDEDHAKCPCKGCTAIRELLVAVDAMLDGMTPREAADDLRELGRMHTSGPDEILAVAWDALA